METGPIPSMLATLCSYENWFGPYHPQPLRLMTQLALAFRNAHELHLAQLLLERAVKDSERLLGLDHDLRLGAPLSLRDVYREQQEWARAATVQKEIV